MRVYTWAAQVELQLLQQAFCRIPGPRRAAQMKLQLLQQALASP